MKHNPWLNRDMQPKRNGYGLNYSTIRTKYKLNTLTEKNNDYKEIIDNANCI